MLIFQGVGGSSASTQKSCQKLDHFHSFPPKARGQKICPKIFESPSPIRPFFLSLRSNLLDLIIPHPAMVSKRDITSPKINIEPENDGLEDDFPLPGGAYSQVPAVNLRVCTIFFR